MGGQKIRSELVMRRFGQNLRRERKLKNVTQEDLAKKSGIALSQISRIETGKLNTTISTIAFISHALDIQPEALVDGIDIIEPQAVGILN